MVDLPRNVALVRELLAGVGALDASVLQELLRDRGAVMGEHLLVRLPERFPEIFAVQENGAIGLMSRIGVAEEIPDAHGDVLGEGGTTSGWWQEPRDVEPLELGSVLVLDFELAGGQREPDGFHHIRTLHLGTGATWAAEKHPGLVGGS